MVRRIVLSSLRTLAPTSASCRSQAGSRSGRFIHGAARRYSEALGTAAKLPDAEPIPTKKPRDAITINDILKRRAAAGKLVAGTAAYSDSDMFKAPVSNRPRGYVEWYLMRCPRSLESQWQKDGIVSAE